MMIPSISLVSNKINMIKNISTNQIKSKSHTNTNTKMNNKQTVI